MLGDIMLNGLTGLVDKFDLLGEITVLEIVGTPMDSGKDTC